jgi:hypothetical protein
MTPQTDEQWFWCLSHQQVEPSGRCRAADRMGPYATPEEARAWQERLEQRADDWEAKEDWEREDERWRDG